MKVKEVHEAIQKIVTFLTVIWGLFLVPSVILVIFTINGSLGFPTDNETVLPILHYNILLFPILLIVSISASWICLIKKKYWPAIVFSLLPLLNVFIEIIAADIALFLG